jgi:NhaP-type Na+/H+ or K+/H+ antiporter
VFALLALEELGPSADTAVGAVALTVLASVVLHGVTARPGGHRYAQRENSLAGPVVRRSSAALNRR